MACEDLTRHARRRCAQRSISAVQVELLRFLGTDAPDGIWLPARRALDVASDLRALAKEVERTGTLFMATGERGEAITAYRMRRRKAKAVRRRTADRDMEIM